MPRPVLAAAAFAAFALPFSAAAQSSDPVGCMDTGYNAAEQSGIDAYVSGFDLDAMDPDDALSEALARRAAQCAQDNGWSMESLMPLLQYRFSGLMIEGITAQRPDIVETVNRIDTELSPEKRARFYRVFEASVFGANEGDGTGGLSEEDDQFFTDTILGPPVSGSEEQAEGIGGYLAARVMQREARQQMAAIVSTK